MNFADLGLSDELLQAVEAAGYTEPTPIQAQAIPQVLMMKDLIAIAQTGTGKTASFVLPMIDILAAGRRRARMPRSLILAPTRELAVQVAENFEKYGKNHDLKMALLIGGVQMGDQVKALDEGVDVLIATPGRLMDLFERGKILLTGCEMLVIDEADRMLDMGFIPDIETICEKLPTNRQTLLFSATMPPPIKKLADRFLTNPKSIEVARPATANINIAQHKVPVSARRKREVLRHLLKTDDVQTAIVFANRKTTVRELNKSLQSYGFRSGEIHGDMDQSSRLAELALFKSGEINILVASDVAARGLDVKGVSHVFNFDTPWHPDDYIHRIGRTGRAGAKGRAFTLVTSEDAEAIANVEKLTGIAIPVFEAGEGESGGGSESPAEKPKRGRGRRSEGAEEREAERPKRSRSRRSEAVEEHEADQPAEDREDDRREDQPKREARKPRRETRRRDEPAAPAEEPTAPGEWNGPVPGFLNLSAG
ncbi:DEAD/DEAH box helicase [Altererythrobacter sp. B11]|uniref:DEAD/DEAH box helicase n=1 Tax=Altererythrobacter sp. B11 TaxID=2060312 RepID=UPI000DC72AF5|nr:DEAD/DEAH box helicase [Altererythrobacter sp. B11]BBC72625.1 DEAD/DEAH box helicase [Altererythrobacter sp. B11]